MSEWSRLDEAMGLCLQRLPKRYVHVKSTKEKSKQNITRDIEIKNNLTIARGKEGRGKWAEGFSGTTIKDTWTKPWERWKQGREGGLAQVWGGSGGE